MRNVAIPLPQLGIDLLTDETSLPKGTVREAVNVDLKKSGAFARRRGYETAVAGDGFHSLYSDPKGTLVGRGTKLYALDTQTYTPTLLCDMGLEAPIDFTRYNGHVYLTNRGSSWWIPSDDGIPRPLGVALPATLPTLSATATDGGRMVALSFVDERGEESPTKLLGKAPAGTFTLLGLEQRVGCKYRVYVTPDDGDVLYRVAEFDAVFAQFIVPGNGPDGAVRTSQHLRPMPAGDFIRGYAGRLYVVRDDTVYYSEPLRPHLYDPRHNFIKFVGNVRMFEPVDAGILVGDDRGIWFMPGNDPTKFTLEPKSDALAIRRSALRIPDTYLPGDSRDPDTTAVVWLSSMGYMVGRPNGSVTSMHPERIVVAADLEGKSVLVLHDGMKQIVTLVAASTSAAQTFGVAIDSSIQ